MSALRATGWMTGAVLSFTSMAVAGRAVSVELDTFETMMYRSAIGLTIVLTVSGAAGRLGDITSRRMGDHLIRNIGHFTGQNLWFYALTVIPLAQVFALEFTAPLWVTLLAPLVLGERLTAQRVAVACAGFAGILIVVRPDPTALDPGAAYAALAAVGFAISILYTKRLTTTETITCVLFWLTAIQLVLGIATAGIDGTIAWPSAATWPWLILIGCAGLLAHFCYTHALAIAPATLVVPMDFVRLPLIAIVGMALYAEPLEWPVFVGAAVIFGANYVNLWTAARHTARG